MTLKYEITISSEVKIFIAKYSANASFPSSIMMVSARLEIQKISD